MIKYVNGANWAVDVPRADFQHDMTCMDHWMQSNKEECQLTDNRHSVHYQFWEVASYNPSWGYNYAHC